MPEESDRNLLIDAALTTYADPGSDSDLAGRILNRLASEPAPSPRLRWLPWAIALPAAICLLLLVHSGLKISKSQAGPRTGQVNQTAKFRNPDGVSVRPPSNLARRPESAQQGKLRQSEPQQFDSLAPHPRPVAAASQPLPKLDVFPTPEPLTSQEQALAEFVAHTPQSEQQALAQSEQLDAPLTVASIHVMPLESPDEGGN